jgi:hypothetical protein
MGEQVRMHTGVLLESQKEIDHQEDVNTGGRIILKRIRGEISLYGLD